MNKAAVRCCAVCLAVGLTCHCMYLEAKGERVEAPGPNALGTILAAASSSSSVTLFMSGAGYVGPPFVVNMTNDDEAVVGMPSEAAAQKRPGFYGPKPEGAKLLVAMDPIVGSITCPTFCHPRAVNDDEATDQA